jgi:hypothetical protein
MITQLTITDYAPFVEPTAIPFAPLTLIAGDYDANAPLITMALMYARATVRRIELPLHEAWFTNFPMARGNIEAVWAASLTVDAGATRLTTRQGEFTHVHTGGGVSIHASSHAYPDILKEHVLWATPTHCTYGDRFFLTQDAAVSILRMLRMAREFSTASAAAEIVIDMWPPHGLGHTTETTRSEQVMKWMEYIFPNINRSRLIPPSYSARPRATALDLAVERVLMFVEAGLGAGSTAQQRPTLVLEYPEIFLTEQSQSRLGVFLYMLACHDAQVIVVTHSSHLLNGIRVAVGRDYGEVKPPYTDSTFHCLFVQKEAPLLTVLRSNTRGSLEQWPRGFFDQYEDDLEEMLGFGFASWRDGVAQATPEHGDVL